MNRWFADGRWGGGEPSRINARVTVTGHPASPVRDPEGGGDTDRDFIIRYGDPFD